GSFVEQAGVRVWRAETCGGGKAQSGCASDWISAKTLHRRGRAAEADYGAHCVEPPHGIPQLAREGERVDDSIYAGRALQLFGGRICLSTESGGADHGKAAE